MEDSTEVGAIIVTLYTECIFACFQKIVLIAIFFSLVRTTNKYILTWAWCFFFIECNVYVGVYTVSFHSFNVDWIIYTNPHILFIKNECELEQENGPFRIFDTS